MAAFEEWLRDFGRQLGIEGLAPAASGTVELEMEQLGRLQIEERDGTVFVTLARPWPQHAERVARTALDRCHWRENPEWPAHAGAAGKEWLSFTLAVRIEGLDLPAMERALRQLSALHDEIGKAG